MVAPMTGGSSGGSSYGWTPPSGGPNTAGSSGASAPTMSYSGTTPPTHVWSGGSATPSGGAPSGHPSQGNMHRLDLAVPNLMAIIANMPASQIAHYQRLMFRSSGLSATPGTTQMGVIDNSTQSGFNELFLITARYNEGKPPEQRLTWAEMLRLMAKQGGDEDGGAGGYGSTGSGGGPTTYTSSNVSLTGKAAAGEHLERAMTELLGRAPTKAEESRFRGVLNSEERGSPSVTTTTSDGQGNSSSTTKQSNVDPYAEAKDYSEKGPRKVERGAYSVNQYAEALESLLGG